MYTLGTFRLPPLISVTLILNGPQMLQAVSLPCGLRRAPHRSPPCTRRMCVARAQPSNGLDAPLRSQVGHPRVDLDACACGCVPDIRSNGSGFEAPVQG